MRSRQGENCMFYYSPSRPMTKSHVTVNVGRFIGFSPAQVTSGGAFRSSLLLEYNKQSCHYSVAAGNLQIKGNTFATYPKGI